MPRKLNIFYESEQVGTLVEDEEELLSFRYSADWLDNPDSFPLSLALKLEEKPFGHAPTKSFFENLLPESSLRKELSKNPPMDDNDFNFLRRYGDDCAGAFSVIEGDSPPFSPPHARLREVSLRDIERYWRGKKNLGSAILEKHGGKFSLAGAQDKFAVIYMRKKILIPIDGKPTTHIIKPPIRNHPDSPYNEYFCMKLAKRVRLGVPGVDIILGKLGKIPLFVVERFDRRKQVDGETRRIHQQDFCQALGLTSSKKYQEEGGPSLKEQYHVIKKYSNTSGRDTVQFFGWMWFNILIGNNDCHSKNLALMTTPSGPVLAPFYDLLCTSIYPEYDKKFSYSIGGNWHWDKYEPRNFKLLANECDFSAKAIFKMGRDMIKKMDTHLDREVERFREKFGHGDAAEKICQEIRKRTAHLRDRIEELRG